MEEALRLFTVRPAWWLAVFQLPPFRRWVVEELPGLHLGLGQSGSQWRGPAPETRHPAMGGSMVKRVKRKLIMAVQGLLDGRVLKMNLEASCRQVDG